jgi:hypothetical protein
VQQWLSDLASADASLREKARDGLMGLRSTDLPALQAAVTRARPLLPSQRAALHEIVMQVYLTEQSYPSDPQSGFLGVSLAEVLVDLTAANAADPGNVAREALRAADAQSRGGVLIIRRIPGFCGFRSLQDGDVVIGLEDGEHRGRAVAPMRTADDLHNGILGRRAGQKVRLHVLREGQVRVVPVTLDAKPVDIEGVGAFEQTVQEREALAEQYWQKTFVPLLGDQPPESAAR